MRSVLQHRLVTAMLSMLLCSTSSFTLAPFQTQSPSNRETRTPTTVVSTPSSLGATMSGAIAMASPSTQQSLQANFEECMRKLVVTDTESRVRQNAASSVSSPFTSNNHADPMIPLSSVVRQVKTLKEYIAVLKEVVNVYDDDVDAPITVVRFYSTYCPACKKAQPAYHGIIRKHLAQQQQNQQQQQQRGINWVDVEANSSNLDLQQALGLKTIPTGLIYHPQAGLVEEMSFGKRNLKNVQEKIQSYLDNECKLVEAASLSP